LKLLLLVNSSASSVTARGRVVIQKALAADHQVTLAETSRRGHATRLAQSACGDGTDAVVVLGGDGTLNEAANGLAGSSCALAPLPGGSTNVFARTIGLPNDPIEATSVLLDALADGSIRRVGLGSVNGRYFLFHVGLGYDAAVVAQVERRDTLKRYLGHPLFAYSAVSTWFRHYEHDRPRFTLHHADGDTVESAFTIVLNTNPYTYLGNRPFDVAPEATLTRGLVVMALKRMTVPHILRLAGRALSKGGPPVSRLRTVDYRADVTELTVTGIGPFPYQVDGDHLGDTEQLTFRHDPEVLSLVVPDSRHVARRA
jgi:diacylglycerol kinase family enzyme